MTAIIPSQGIINSAISIRLQRHFHARLLDDCLTHGASTFSCNKFHNNIFVLIFSVEDLKLGITDDSSNYLLIHVNNRKEDIMFFPGLWSGYTFLFYYTINFPFEDTEACLRSTEYSRQLVVSSEKGSMKSSHFCRKNVRLTYL